MQGGRRWRDDHPNGRGSTRGFGFNEVSELYEDLVSMGVIDPTMVVRSALENAAPVASLTLKIDTLIAAQAKDSS